LPELDIAGADTTAIVCGLRNIAESGMASAIVNATGEYSGECTPQNIRSFMIDVTYGTHPEKSAEKHNINDTDYMHLNNLLEIEEYWHENIMNRVLMVRVGFGKWFKVGKELKTWNPSIIWSWMREAKRIEKYLKRLCA
jgi:hypothetical protein